MATIERERVTEGGLVKDLKRGNGRKKRVDECVDAVADIDSICRTLQSMQRQKVFARRQRIRGENAITAYVAWNACGFHAGLPSEAERLELWKKAEKVIKEIDDGDRTLDADQALANDDSPFDDERSRVTGVVRVSQISRKVWRDYENAIVKEMERLAGQLPVAEWLKTKECDGISLGMLATLVGEAGNLSNYPNPAKLWKRLFGAPIEKNGKVMMPSRWRLEGGLSAEEWEAAGYSPKRHSTQQQLKENIVRQNRTKDQETKEITWVGPYRRRYDEARERTRVTHPEWWVCSKCEGTGKISKKKCANCKGTGEVTMHVHRHAQLLAAKRFVRDLWNKWHGVEEIPDWRHET
jgi:hypothetical protein